MLGTRSQPASLLMSLSYWLTKDRVGRSGNWTKQAILIYSSLSPEISPSNPRSHQATAFQVSVSKFLSHTQLLGTEEVSCWGPNLSVEEAMFCIRPWWERSYMQIVGLEHAGASRGWGKDKGNDVQRSEKPLGTYYLPWFSEGSWLYLWDSNQ